MKTPATEENTGLESRSCTECGAETDSRVIEKLPHTHNYVTDTKEATCTTDGYVKKTCACGSVISTVIPATGTSVWRGCDSRGNLHGKGVFHTYL